MVVVESWAAFYQVPNQIEFSAGIPVDYEAAEWTDSRSCGFFFGVMTVVNQNAEPIKCQWRWIPGYIGTYLWCNDPEFRLSKGGGGVVVAKLKEVRNKGKRSTEKLVLLKKVQRGRDYAYWISRKDVRSEDGVTVHEQWMTDQQIRDLAAAEGGDGPGGVILESVVDPDGGTVVQRVGSHGAIRMVDGGRVGSRGDSVPVVVRGSAEHEQSDCSWQLIDGSEGWLRCRVAGQVNVGGCVKRFGDVAVKASNGVDWREILPDAPGVEGRYVFSVPDVNANGGWKTKRMTFEEIMKGLR